MHLLLVLSGWFPQVEQFGDIGALFMWFIVHVVSVCVRFFHIGPYRVKEDCNIGPLF